MSEKRFIPKGQLLKSVNLARFTSWHIGGNAEWLYWPADLEDLKTFLPTLDASLPITWLGLGSNVLVREGGIKGVVIITQGVLTGLALLPNGQIFAQAGLSCAQVARFAARQHRVEGEFLAGIPGTIGGALRMNAGAFGGETWDKVVAVQTIDRCGNIHHRLASEFHPSYRQVQGLAQDEWFVGGYFELPPGDGAKSLQAIKSLLAKRSETQPTGEPTCGSVFRNPPGDFAARLIDSLGFKGYCVGGAQVSHKHANFIVNQGQARACEVEQLIEKLRVAVLERYGVELEPEVKILGEEPN